MTVKRTVSIGCGIIIMFLIGGCASDVMKIAEETTVGAQPVFDGYYQNQEAVGYLADKFAAENTFTPEEKRTLLNAEYSLLNEFSYLQEIITVAGSVPYYEYMASYKRLKRNIKQLRNILDKHVAKYPKDVRIIYSMTRDNIQMITVVMDQTISDSSTSINKENSKAMVKQLTSLYSAVKPLISSAAILM